MIDLQSFKEQVLDFVEDMEEPFDVKFLVRNCNHLIDDATVYDALYELEEEGRIVRLDGEYLSTRVMMRRWLKPQKPNPEEQEPLLPQNMAQQIWKLIEERPDLGYADLNEFVKDAVRRLIQQIKNRG